MERVEGVQESVQGEGVQAQAAENAMFNPQSLGTKSNVNNIDESSLINVLSD